MVRTGVLSYKPVQYPISGTKNELPILVNIGGEFVPIPTSGKAYAHSKPQAKKSVDAPIPDIPVKVVLSYSTILSKSS